MVASVNTALPDIVLHVCVTCRAGEPEGSGDGVVAGQRLFNALAVRLPALAAGLDLRATTCLANCERGCSAVLSNHTKWTYLLGRLSPDLAGDLLAYARSYAMSATGTVMPSRRPPSLRTIVMGRVPPVQPAVETGS